MHEWSEVIPLLLNILLVSIPEEAFLTLFSLILMKRYDLLDVKKSNISRIAIIVVFVAVSSTLLRACSVMSPAFAPFYGLLVIFFLTVFLFGIKTPKGLLKAFLSVCASFLSVMVMELLVYPALTSIPGFNIDNLNKPGLMTIILSIPERTVQVILVTILLLKRQNFMKLGFFKVLSRNKPFAYISGGLVVFNLLFIYIMFKLIYYNNILAATGELVKVLVVAFVIIFPLMNLSVLFGVINYSVNKYAYTRVYVQEETRALRVLVHTLLQQQRYAEVDSQL